MWKYEENQETEVVKGGWIAKDWKNGRRRITETICHIEEKIDDCVA